MPQPIPREHNSSCFSSISTDEFLFSNASFVKIAVKKSVDKTETMGIIGLFHTHLE
jgi:hypothetical protein